MLQLTILSDFYRSAFHHNVEEAFNASLKALDIGYIDLYLMHWPQAIVDGILVLVTTTWVIISDHVSHLGRTLKEDEHPNNRKSHENPQAWLCGTGVVMWNENCMLYAR